MIENNFQYSKKVFHEKIELIANSRDGVFVRVLEGGKNYNAFLPLNSQYQDEFENGKKLYYFKQEIVFKREASAAVGDQVSENTVVYQNLKQLKYTIIHTLSFNETTVNENNERITKPPIYFEKKNSENKGDTILEIDHFGKVDCAWVARKANDKKEEKAQPLVFKLTVDDEGRQNFFYLGVETDGEFVSFYNGKIRFPFYFCPLKPSRKSFDTCDGIAIDDCAERNYGFIAIDWDFAEETRSGA